MRSAPTPVDTRISHSLAGMSLLCVRSADSPQPTLFTLLRTTESRPQPHGSFILAIVRTSSPPFVRNRGLPRLCRLAQPFCRRYRRRVLQSRLRLLRDSRLCMCKLPKPTSSNAHHPRRSDPRIRAAAAAPVRATSRTHPRVWKVSVSLALSTRGTSPGLPRT